MTINPYWAVGLCNAAFVAMRSLQQRNVIHENWAWIMPVSLTMATFELYVVASVAHYGYGLWLVLSGGIGAGIGCMGGMLFHKYVVRNGKNSTH